jgi:hypothetical protein
MPRTSYAGVIVHWGHVDTRIQANKPALDHLESLRAQLEVERVGLVNATNRQSALKAEAQSASRDIDGHLARGMELATRLRDAIRAHYGRSEEKLAEFGMQPLRTRGASRRAKNKKPSEADPTSAQAA